MRGSTRGLKCQNIDNVAVFMLHFLVEDNSIVEEDIVVMFQSAVDWYQMILTYE